MPIIQYPKSIDACMDFLDRAAIQAEKVKDEPEYRKITAWFNTVKDVQVRFLEARTAYRHADHALLNKRQEVNVCTLALSQHVRDFDVVLARRIVRNKEPDHLYRFYKMPNEKIRWATNTNWKRYAEDRVNGDLQAVAMGYPTMANPSVEDLQACLANYELLEGEVSQLDRFYKTAQLDLEVLVKETEDIWYTLRANINAVCRRMSDEGRRRILRSFGYVFSVERESSEESGESTTTSTGEAGSSDSGSTGSNPDGSGQSGNSPPPVENPPDGNEIPPAENPAEGEEQEPSGESNRPGDTPPPEEETSPPEAPSQTHGDEQEANQQDEPPAEGT